MRPANGMGRVLGIMLAATLVVASSAEARKTENTALRTDLANWFQGREFTNRVVLGSYLDYYMSSLGTNIRRTVCIVVDQGGRYSYLVAGKGIFPPEAVDVRQADAVINGGRMVRVNALDLDPSRVEIQVVDTETGLPACIRLKFAAGYQDTSSVDDVLARLSGVLDLGPDYSRGRQLEAEYATLLPRLAASRATWAASAGMDDDERRLKGEALRVDLEELKAIVIQSETLRGQAPLESRQLTEELDALAAAMAAMEEAHRMDSVARLHAKLAALAASQSSRIAGLEGAGDKAGLAARSTAIDEARALLEARRGTASELKALGDAATPEEVGAIEADSERIERAAADVAHRSTAAKATASLQEFDRVAAEAKSLRGLVPAAAATLSAQDDQAIQRWSASVARRRALIGSLTAADRSARSTALEEEEKALAALHAQQARASERAALSRLDAGFERLDAERAALRTAYTKSFQTPEQRARAAELIAKLEEIVANRGEAARRGSAVATDQASDARAQIAGLRARNP